MEQLEIEPVPETREEPSKLLEIPRVSSESLNYNDFFQFMILNQPVIITGLSQKWNCSEKWLKNGINFEYLKSQYKDRMVPVSNCSKQYFNSHEKKEISFHAYLAWWQQLIASNHETPESSELLYLKDWHFQREEGYENPFYEVPSYFGSDWLNEHLMATKKDDFRFVYMGPKGSWTAFHSDVYSSFSWSTNIVGKKRWIFLPAGEETKLWDGHKKLPFSIDEDQLKSNNVTYYEIIQGPHEAVFVPSGWYHQVWNLEDTISINHNWFNGTQVNRVYEALKRNLEFVVEELDGWEGLEGSQEHYQVMLKASFGMNFTDFIDIIEFIAQRRLNDSQCPMESTISYGRFCYGENHILFDLERIAKLVDSMLEDEELFSSEELKRLEKIQENCSM